MQLAREKGEGNETRVGEGVKWEEGRGGRGSKRQSERAGIFFKARTEAWFRPELPLPSFPSSISLSS